VEPRQRPPFLPGGKICRLRRAKQPARLPHGNPAYIKGVAFQPFGNELAFPENAPRLSSSRLSSLRLASSKAFQPQQLSNRKALDAAAIASMTGTMLNSLGLEGRPQDTRIVVAMSGGVDSSATAALLKSEGYDVVGITLQLYDHGTATHRKGACCAGRDIHDARDVAERLGIPHYVLDYESRFRESVIDNFADSYASGETPVPCIECNRSIKFRDLLATARELGASALATGHYVASRSLADGSRALVCAADADRDQSYFLFATTREQLDFLRFPLGDMTKPQTRELARRFGLSVADKQDSQDICFVPTGRYTDIISRLRPNAVLPGDIVDLDGRVIGGHQGIVHFTVGQRRGLGIASSAPFYVVRLEAASRRVVVGPREALRMDRIVLRDVNWIGDGALDRAVGEGLEIFVRVRSTRAPQPAWLRAADGGYEVELVAGEEGVSPGQACVFYDAPSGQARVLGGGFIQSATASSTTGKGTARPQPLAEAMR
jgi:tRNA-specific 2-thiouridylase